MTQIQKAVLLASTMLGIAVLAIFDIIPQEIAQFAPVALLALFPSAWLSSSGRCAGRC